MPILQYGREPRSPDPEPPLRITSFEFYLLEDHYRTDNHRRRNHVYLTVNNRAVMDSMVIFLNAPTMVFLIRLAGRFVNGGRLFDETLELRRDDSNLIFTLGMPYRIWEMARRRALTYGD